MNTVGGGAVFFTSQPSVHTDWCNHTVRGLLWFNAPMTRKISDSARKKADAFLSLSKDFHLGGLPTEQRHPETTHLADLSRQDLKQAFQLLKKVDLTALNI